MSVANGLKTTLDIINAAGTVLNPNDPREARAIKEHKWIQDKAQKAYDTADRLNRTTQSIASVSQQTTILSRAFVDGSIADEPILPNLFRTIHEWYAAQIISALHLSRMVTDQTTVQDIMSLVQTGYNNRSMGTIGNAASHIRNRRMGMESFLNNYHGEPALESSREDPFELVTKHQLDDLEAERDHYKNKAEQGDKGPSYSSLSVRSVEPSGNRIGPMGELFEIKLTNPNNKEASVIVPVFIQMQPSIIAAEVAPRFIDMNVMPALWQRWTQMRSGEITFWKDFLLNRDLIRRFKSTIKDPKVSASFSDFLKSVSKKDQYALGDATDPLGGRQSQNLANSVIILSEETVAQAKADSGIDLHREQDRARYFRDTYSMIVVIIDPLHQRVTVYFNSIDGSINVPYNDFRPKDQKFDPSQFMGALSAFSSNNINSISRMR